MLHNYCIKKNKLIKACLFLNPKSEARNPKQIQNPNDQNYKRFEHLKIKKLEFVSYFEFRI